MRLSQVDTEDSEQLVQLWSRVGHLDWRSLVLVPAHPEGTALFCGRGLLALARQALGSAPQLLDGRNASLGEAARLASLVKTSVAQGARVLAVVDSVLTRPAGLEIARQCQAGLLVVALGEADLHSARRTLELCRNTPFLGAVVLSGASPRPRPAEEPDSRWAEGGAHPRGAGT